MGLGVLLWAGCGGLTGGSIGIGHAIMPEADLIVAVDMAGLRAAPIYPELEAMFGDEGKGPDALSQVAGQFREFAAAAGLEAGNEAEILVAADLPDMDTGLADFDTTDVVVAVQLLSPLGPDDLREMILASDPAAAGELEISESEEAGYPISIVEVREAGDTKRLHVAHAEDGHLLFFGSEFGVGGAVRRHSGGGAGLEMEGELAAARDVLPEGAQVRLLFAVPDELRSSFEERAQAARDGQVSDPSAMMMLPALEALTGLRTVSLGVVAGETLDIALVGRLGTPEEASKLRATLDGFLGLAQMGLMAGTGGEAAGFLETLRVETAESDVTLGVQFTRADLEMLRRKGEGK